MSNLKLCVVDTNVPKIANLATKPDANSDVPGECILACIEAVEQVTKRRSLVIDAGDEIFDEYRRQLSMSGQPGIGDRFMRWVHDNRWQLPDSQRVAIKRLYNSYVEFPDHEDLKEFDLSDRKFVSVSNAHPEKPLILQATDSKWWAWKETLAEVGIQVCFLCSSYAETKCREKLGDA
jgi:hypothetical protein